jgi:hypothetical protein
MPDVEQHPEPRDPKTAVAHTKEQGGYYYPGGAEPGDFHSCVFEDGWVYDITLAAYPINGGWRLAHDDINNIKRLADMGPELVKALYEK